MPLSDAYPTHPQNPVGTCCIPNAEAGEPQSTVRRYNVALRAAEQLGCAGPVVQQIHKRIAQAASRVGFQPYLL